MGRKPVPQPLTLADGNPGSESFSSPSLAESRSAKSLSPRSPFRFAQQKSPASVPAGQGNKQAQQASEPRPPPTRQENHSPVTDPQFLPPLASAVHPSYDQQRANPPSRFVQKQNQLRQERLRQQEQEREQQRERQQPQPQPQPQQQQEGAKEPLALGYGHAHNRHDEDKASKSGFFFNFSSKPAKSSDRLNTHQFSDSRGETMSRDADHPASSKQNASKHPADKSESFYPDRATQKSVSNQPSKSDISLSSADNDSTKKGKPKTFGLLSRTRSVKGRDTPSPKEAAPVPLLVPEPERAYPAGPLKTAPIQAHDRSFRDMMSSGARNHSAERAQPREMPVTKGREHGRDQDRDTSRGHPSSLKENTGPSFFSGLKNSSSKAANILSQGIFGKNARGAVEKEPAVDDEHYVLKVINLPLVEQTRRTRISKRLEESRDKTEFWMPAFPWRAIDYLNYKGSDVEGLYRVPGSGPQIKKWQRKFDEEGDVDLFEQKELYDINIIGSMLKAWLRELPDELFPKEAQERIARECVGSETVPQLLVDELSNLSPFKYYLLFAITCHLSLLLAHSDKNKMDFRNLCICFQPCMKIDAFCFKFLVCDWRDCWKGCKNEAKYIEEEYALFDQPPPPRIGEGRDGQESRNKGQSSHAGPGNGLLSNGNHSPINGLGANQADVEDDGNATASESTKQPNRIAHEQKARLRKKGALENGSVDTTSTISTTLTVSSERDSPPRHSNDLRPLSPIKPLSPLGF